MKIDLDLQERIYLTELLTKRLQDYECMSDDEIDINERMWQRLFVSAMERREYNKSVEYDEYVLNCNYCYCEDNNYDCEECFKQNQKRIRKSAELRGIKFK